MEFNKLKPKMNLGEIISNSFKLVINNALELLKIISIFILPVFVAMFIVILALVFSMLRGAYIASPEELLFGILAMTIPIILISIVISLISYFGYAVIIKMLGDRYSGQESGWKYAAKCAWGKKWSLIGMNLLIMLILFIAYIALILLSVLVGFITFGIGFIIIIPIIIAIAIVVSPMFMLFNSMLLIKDLSAMDAIKQTFELFKRGSFWSMVGKCAAIGGISIGISILISILAIIPILGFIVIVFGGMYTQAFTISACNIIVIEDMKSSDVFNEENLIE